MPRRWPNLFIVGVPKGGTTSLWRYLDRHPDIYMSPFKEPHFFLGSCPPDMALTEAEYLELFARATHETWLGEASTRYISDDASPELIKRTVPEARILISLRDPAERAYSDYWSYVKFGLETRPFDAVVAEELDEPDTSIDADPYKLLVNHGFYTTHVERYLSVFGDRVHIGFLEDLQSDAQSEVRSILEFLGVDASPADALPPDAHNSFALPRNWAAGKLMASQRALRAGRAIFPEPWRTRVERLVLRQGGKPPMSEAVRARLRTVYEPDRKPLERVLGRQLPW
jgi:hypothetical protein